MKTFIQLVCTLIITTAFFCIGNKVYGVGAVTPFISYEAEAGLLGGGAAMYYLTNPPIDQYSSPELEASGHAFVQLASTGQYVQWTNNTGQSITAINLRSCIPDASGGGGIVSTIDMYVNGTFRQAFSVNSQQNYNYEGTNYNGQTDKNPADGHPRNFWNDTHAFVTGAAIASGSTIRFEKDSGNTASFYDIDVVDLEAPPAALGQPANSLSIVSYGAVANSNSVDNTTAINNCFAAAKAQGKVAWIPSGTFYFNATKGGLKATGITIAGAGPWYSTLYRFAPNGTGGAANMITANSCTLSNVLLDCNGWSRDGGNNNGAVNFSGTNWVVNNVWIQHVTSAFWCGGFGGIAENCRVLSVWSDGGNFNNFDAAGDIGINLTYSNQFVRGTGDDSMAINATDTAGHTPMNNIAYVNNTSIDAYGGKGIAVYGGHNLTITNNLITSSARYDGMAVGYFEQTAAISNALVQGNVLLGCGGNGYNQMSAGLQVGIDATNVTDTHITFIGNTISDSLFGGFLVKDCSSLVFQGNTIDAPSQGGITIESTALGNGLFTNNVVSDLNTGESAFANFSGSFAATSSETSWQIVSQGDATADSSDDGVNVPANGNDGDLTTRWAASTGTYPQWWAVDLGDKYILQSATIDWYNAASRYYQYDIQVSSDGVNYTTVVNKTGNTTMGNTTDTFSATNRYVRVYVTGASAGYASFYECQLFGNPVPGVLLSQGEPTTASSDDGVNFSSNANDGNTTSTRWAASTGSFPQTWTVNLGSSHTLKSVTTDWYNASSRYYQYQIQVSSDDVHFTTVVDKSGNTTDGNTTDTFSATGQYVRINVTGSSTGYASFYECQVFGN